MLAITTCPDCDKKLKLPDKWVGKKCRCPGCSIQFVARPDPVEEEAPARAATSNGYSERRAAPLQRDHDDRDRPRRRDDEYDDEPRRRDDYEDDYDRGPRHANVAKGWRGTRLGLMLVIVGNWVFLGMIAVAIIGSGILLLTGASLLNSFASSGPPVMDEAGARRAATGMAGAAIGLIIFFGLLALLYFATTILQLVGQGICMMVPNNRGNAMRGLAIAAFACACAALLLGIGTSAAGLRRGGTSFNGLLGLASFVCWILFLRLVAIECRAPELGKRLIIYMISMFAGTALVVVLFVIAMCGGALALSQASSQQGAAGTLGVLGIVMFIFLGLVALAGLGLFVWYTLLMQQVRAAIGRHLSRL
jgi:hypothetical protein